MGHVEDKMRRFKGECEHFSFNKCPIYTHDGGSAKFTTNSQEMGNSVIIHIFTLNHTMQNNHAKSVILCIFKPKQSPVYPFITIPYQLADRTSNPLLHFPNSARPPALLDVHPGMYQELATRRQTLLLLHTQCMPYTI
jgi:hypothetical protein